MKRVLSLLLCLAFLGCTHTTATTAPAGAIAPGYFNTADQQMGQALAAADAFYRRIQANVTNGTMTLTPAESHAMSDLYIALNMANATYLAYHNGTGSAATAQADINAVTTKQQAVVALGVK